MSATILKLPVSADIKVGMLLLNVPDDDIWVDASDIIDLFLKCPFKALICPNKVWKLK